MKTTKLNNITLLQVCEDLSLLARCEARFGSQLILSDMQVSLDAFISQFSNADKPNEWYFAIRNQGTEAGYSKEYVEKRCECLGAAYITIKVDYDRTNGRYNVTINRTM